MREIKFRAWHPSVGKMFEWKEMERRSGYRWVFVTEGETNVTEWGNYKLIKLQYTGLKDKNGKEIYEGDYVRIVYKLREDGVYEVAWNQEHCCFMMGRMLPDNSDADTVYFGNQFDYEYEVVGNIYEHPELVK